MFKIKLISLKSSKNLFYFLEFADILKIDGFAFSGLSFFSFDEWPPISEFE